ncbi:uncharacterized protein JCM6883_005713 [Sporobolomyces salmoneus]|uniref:uncharacterized protein n=1 Tax=Sporobolomyces salmoneus TaxID=183962 RepID=UPI00317D63A7
MSSYITLDDLESLNLTPPTRPPRSSKRPLPTSTDQIQTSSSFLQLPATSTSSGSGKQVSFCPRAVLIEVADEGEIEPAMVEAFKRDLGKKQIGVRTYSLETPNLGHATSRAWASVLNGLSATLDPFLSSSGPPSSGGVVSSSRRRESSPDRDREFVYKCPDSRSPRRRRGSVGSSHSGRDGSDNEEEEEEDPNFIPNEPTRLRLKIPTVKRRCSRPCLLTKTSKSCLRSPSPLPTPTIHPSSSSSTSSSLKPLPTLSRSPSEEDPPLPISHPHAGTLVPVVQCCEACYPATEYGHASKGEGYVERWSRGAKKLRAEQEKERREKEEWERDSEVIRAPYQSTTSTVQDEKEKKGEGEEWQEIDEDFEESLRGSKLSQKAKGVDELQLGKDQRHVKTIYEKEDRSGGGGRKTGQLTIDISSYDSRVSQRGKLSPIESISPRSFDTTNDEDAATTPSSSDVTPQTSPELSFSPSSLPSNELSLPPAPPVPSTERPSLAKSKQRSSSFSKRIASAFGSFSSSGARF